MKKIQRYRSIIQILCLVLTVVGFFTNFRGTMIVIMSLTLLSGVFYCGWVCPYGFIQDLFSRLGKLLGIKKKKMPLSIQKILVFSRYTIFALVALIGTDFIFNIMSFDPRVNFVNILSGNMITIGAIGIMCFFVFIALFFERPFCNYFCFEGAKYGLMSYFRPFTIRRDTSTCVDCKKCDKACPMNIKISKYNNLRSPQCINCFQCISSCPVRGALDYGKIHMPKREKKRYLAILTSVLVLIGAFLVYNMYNETDPLKVKNKQHAEITPSQTYSPASDEIIDIPEEDTKNIGDAAGIADGVYTGTGQGFRGPMSVQITVKNEQIVAVEVLEHIDDRKWFNRANNVLPDRIVESQSTDVDMVSGATYSSIGIRDGVIDALKKAK